MDSFAFYGRGTCPFKNKKYLILQASVPSFTTSPTQTTKQQSKMKKTTRLLKWHFKLLWQNIKCHFNNTG